MDESDYNKFVTVDVSEWKVSKLHKRHIFFKEPGKAIELTHTMSAVPAKDPNCCNYGDKDPGEGCTQDTVALGK